MNIKKRPAPAYQEYASDILANAQYRMMTLSERGLLYTMRKECWVNGSIPANPNDLASYLKFEVQEIQTCLSKKVLSFFKAQEESLICPELEQYRQMLEDRNRKMSEGGKKGGKTTQNRHRGKQSTPEPTIKPLSRSEMSGDELGRAEVSGGELGYSPPTISLDFNSSTQSVNEWIKQHNKYVEEVERRHPSPTKISTR